MPTLVVCRKEVKTGSPDRHAAIADRLIEFLCNAFDAFSGGIEGPGHGVGRGLRAIGRNEPGILQGSDIFLETAYLLHRLIHFVGQHQCSHHRQSRVADFTELAPQADDALVDILGERLQMIFLPILASETELAAGDGGGDLSHGLLVHLQHRLDCRNRVVQSLCNFPVGGFEPA